MKKPSPGSHPASRRNNLGGSTGTWSMEDSCRTLEQRVQLQDVLTRYDLIELGTCKPIHCTCGNGALDICIESNSYNCPHCTNHGGVVGLVAILEDVDMEKAAKMLSQWFPTESQQSTSIGSINVQRNRPIQPLEGINSDHEQVLGLNISSDSVEHFGIGYYGDDNSDYHGNVVMPLYNAHGELIAYSKITITHFTAEDFKIVPDEGYLASVHPEPHLFNPHIDILGVDKLPEGTMDKLYIVRDPVNMLAVWEKVGDRVISFVGDIPSSEQVEIVSSLVQSRNAKLHYVIDNEGYHYPDDLFEEMIETLVLGCSLKSPIGIENIGNPDYPSRTLTFPPF